MQVSQEMFVLALVAISFVGAVAVLLAILMMCILSQRKDSPLSLSPAVPLTTPPSVILSKRIANATVAMSAGLTAIVFAARLVPIQPNTPIAIILLVGGLAAIFLARVQFLRIR